MAYDKCTKTLAVIPARFEPGIQARNRVTEQDYWVQMVLEDRAEFASYPLHLVEPEGNA